MVHCFLLPFGLVFSVQSQTATRIERRICVIVQDSADSNLGEFWKTFVKLSFSINIAKLFTIKFTKRSVNVRNKNVKDNLLAKIIIMIMIVVMTINDDRWRFLLILFPVSTIGSSSESIWAAWRHHQTPARAPPRGLPGCPCKWKDDIFLHYHVWRHTRKKCRIQSDILAPFLLCSQQNCQIYSWWMTINFFC